MTTLPDTTTVLIVGAGPAGLASALSLNKQGVTDFTIVDAVAQGDNASRALVVHAATLEALDTIGCAQELIGGGIKNSVFRLWSQTSPLAEVNFDTLKGYTKFPFALSAPQSLTEQILHKKLKSLGVHIHRPLKVVGMRRHAQDNAYTDVTFENGSVIRAKYIIGADGARSVVRTNAGIGFADPDGTDIATLEGKVSQLCTADVILNNEEKVNKELRVIASSGSIFIYVPLPKTVNEQYGRPSDQTIFRLVTGSAEDIPHAPGVEWLQKMADKDGPIFISSDPTVNPNGTTIKDIVWSSRFRTHSAIAERAFIRLDSDPNANPSDPKAPVEGGAILLVGDAAHIHSPTGGQGMNLGIRDAVSIGKPIAEHIKATQSSPATFDDDKILRGFAQERHNRAADVIHFTKSLLGMLGPKYSEKVFWWLPISRATIRDWAIWIGTKPRFVQSRIAWNLSGLGRP